MAQALIAPLAEELDLGDGYKIRLTALDPASGAVVPGVNISKLALEVADQGTGGGGSLEYGPYMLLPGPAA